MTDVILAARSRSPRSRAACAALHPTSALRHVPRARSRSMGERSGVNAQVVRLYPTHLQNAGHSGEHRNEAYTEAFFAFCGDTQNLRFASWCRWRRLPDAHRRAVIDDRHQSAPPPTKRRNRITERRQDPSATGQPCSYFVLRPSHFVLLLSFRSRPGSVTKEGIVPQQEADSVRIFFV